MAHFDPSAIDLQESSAEVVQTMNGCRLSLMMLKEKDVDACIEENYAMLTEEEREYAASTAGYQRAMEVATVAALRDRQAIRSRILHGHLEQHHRNDTYSIDTEMCDGNVRITWTLKQPLPRDARLVGVRKEDGYDPDVSHGMAVGTRISDSDRDGFVTEHLDPEKTMYYTFAVETRDNTSLNPFNPQHQTKHHNPLRFSIRVPSARDNKAQVKAEIEMKRLLEKLNPPSDDDQQLTEALAKIKTYKSMSAMLDSQHAQGLAEINASTASEEEKDRQRSAWGRLFEQLRMTYG